VVLIGLLLVALVCLILGLVLASGPWLVGSLVASVVAGFVLWRQRDQIGSKAAQPTAPAAPTASRQTSLVTGTAFAGKTGPATPAANGADPEAAAAEPATADTQVWVVDGEPQFHTKDCGQLEGKDAEAVPFAQAVEDGFTECPFCAPVIGARVTQVWVLDGRPDYHLEDCSRIGHADSEAVPRAQAVADGFAACDVCHPDRIAVAEPASAESAEPTAAPEPATEPEAPAAPAEPETQYAAPRAATGSVWVVDGRPRYHLEDCLIIKDQGAEPIPLAQATEDGFMPCSMCEPNVTRV
jgi:hypothetical protein